MIQKDTCTPMFTAALSSITKTWRQPKCPLTDEWLKMWYTHAMAHYSASKKNETMPFFTTWMDLEIIILSEANQTETDKYHITYIQYFFNVTNDLKQTNRLRK